jgi:hypothetical protein
MLQLMISYVVIGDRCRVGSALGALGFGPKAIALECVGFGAVVVCVLGLWAAHRTWRLAREEGPGDHHEGLTAGVGRTRFLGLCGIVASSIFVVGAAFEFTVPILVLPCSVPFL